jgi:hypothetical protein
MNFYVDHYDHFDIQIRSVYTSYFSLICKFFPLFNLLYVSIDGSNVYKNDEIVYSFDCHYFDLHRELFQASFSPMKHSKAFIYFFNGA